MELLQLFATWAVLDAEALALGGWAFHQLCVDNEVAAVAAMRGTEIHFACNPTWRRRLITRRRTREFLGPLFDEFGFLTTRAQSHAAREIKFITRLGFVRTYEGLTINHYMLSELPFSKQEK